MTPKETQQKEGSAKEHMSSDPTKEEKPKETGGPKGLEPTRYGDWERKGIVSDF